MLHWAGLRKAPADVHAAAQLSFGNGRLEEFYVHCKCLTPEQMREPEVSRALAVRWTLIVSLAASYALHE